MTDDMGARPCASSISVCQYDFFDCMNMGRKLYHLINRVAMQIHPCRVHMHTGGSHVYHQYAMVFVLNLLVSCSVFVASSKDKHPDSDKHQRLYSEYKPKLWRRLSREMMRGGGNANRNTGTSAHSSLSIYLLFRYAI
jgi:hypothetical protein